ncbi:MOSC domain-containing protein [uncultured Eudoraea sp.]|uniref:MOSC domain-containing protein n=1 Tax=uncultured Eudoraea sp. TaxID=1035614 RepID=UPI0026045968|nr:MOSC domain-containing protein [uncultured Eudoraea sp.]
MQVISTNIGNLTKINWKGKVLNTGIFKYPTSSPLLLEKESVANDAIANRKVHGGTYKACYLFSEKHYPYWKNRYPELDWNWGMFGENLSVSGMDETQIRIGDIYKIGKALVQISQPREPCFKLGIRFGTQQILKEFIEYGFPGTYVKILEEGLVSSGDRLTLIEASDSPLTVFEFFQLLYAREKDQKVLKLALENSALPELKRESLKKYL